MTALAYVDRLRMAICERQGGHDYHPDSMALWWTKMQVDGHEEPVRLACVTEECVCGMGRALLWPVREDGTGPTRR